jgi:hypothetical protein
MSEEHKPVAAPTAARLEQKRESVVRQLCAHYAHDHLNDAELQQRIDQAYQSSSLAALDELCADLPSVEVELDETGLDAPGSPVALARPGEVRDSQVIAAIMGGVERRGSWTPPRKLTAIALMGGLELDFREARFAPGATEVNIFVMWGGVDIVVPPGVRVEANGIAIMAGWEQPEGDAVPLRADAPTLRLNGIALMGGVSLSTRLPGESPREARQRRRLEREQRHRLGRGE